MEKIYVLCPGGGYSGEGFNVKNSNKNLPQQEA